MTINTHITAFRFQFAVEVLKQPVPHLDLAAADPANEMVMILPGNFIGQMTAGGPGGTCQAVFRKKLERAVNGWFGESGQIMFCLLIDLTRGKMFPCMTEHMQDRQALRRHPESAGAELGGIFRGTGHENLYCNFLQ